MVTIAFLGDVMLGRFVAEKYTTQAYQLISDEVKIGLTESDVCIANLESPVTKLITEDSLRFAAREDLLDQFKWVDCFSLSNNHINDFDTEGMTETLEVLNSNGFTHNGLYKDTYIPFLIDEGEERIAVITCADMMNYEFSDECPYKTLRVKNPSEIIASIRHYKGQGYFVILFAHVGMFVTRFPNPVIRDFVHQMVDEGADCVVTAHPHCLGGYESYKDKLIVYSLGDFLMDGASFRRRRAGVLNLSIENRKIIDWSILPVQTNDDLQVQKPDENTTKKMLVDFEWVSKQIAKHSDNYVKFYKKQYRKELITHSWSTIQFEYHRRGLRGLFRTLSKRLGTVLGMAKRVFSDRSKMSYDVDAVSEKNTSINDLR